MPNFERIRDIISEPFTSEIIRNREEAGWRIVAIEWRRELSDAEVPIEAEFDEDIPYGLRVSDDCMRLVAEPSEHQALMLIMEGVALDSSYAEIAERLNGTGFRMRNGRLWNRVAVFGMIPRLIDLGPRFFSSKEWAERTQHFAGPRLAGELNEPAIPRRTWRDFFGRRARL